MIIHNELFAHIEKFFNIKVIHEVNILLDAKKPTVMIDNKPIDCSAEMSREFFEELNDIYKLDFEMIGGMRIYAERDNLVRLFFETLLIKKDK